MSSCSAKVSVVIPVYDRLEYLPATISSVLSQTYEAFELIIVDDGSSCSVQSVVDHFPDERLTLLRQENQGNAVARNKGLLYSDGEFVAFLDSDDLWHPQMLESCVVALEESSDTDVVYTQVQTIDGEGNVLTDKVGPEPKNGDLLHPLLFGFPILPSSTVLRHSRLEQWGAFTPGLDDWDLWLRWAANGCRFRCVERPLIYYRVHDQNFNLNWAARREVHFGTLDTFYSQEDVPVLAAEMRDKVYASEHFRFAVLAWAAGQSTDAVVEFGEAAKLNPRLLEDLDCYYQIACAHQGRLAAGTSRNLDLLQAERALLSSLDTLFADLDGTSTLYEKRNKAYAWAYYTLAKVAYELADESVTARRLLWRSVWRWIPIMWQTAWVSTFLRSLIRHTKLRLLSTLSLRR